MEVSMRISLHQAIHTFVNKDLDRQRMVDHIAPIVRVMILRLDEPVGIFGPSHQRVSPGLLWSKPIKFPAAPRMPINGVYESCVRPRIAAVAAHRDFSYLAFACPS